jgi:excisionase family DNA binding protein
MGGEMSVAFYTIPEAIEYLRSSKSAFGRAVKEGKIRVIKPLHKPLVSKADIDKLIRGSQINNA